MTDETTPEPGTRFPLLDLQPTTYLFGSRQGDTNTVGEFFAFRGGRQFADPNPMPTFVWWPVLNRPREAWYRLRTAWRWSRPYTAWRRSRLSAVWYVLRHGAPVDVEGW